MVISLELGADLHMAQLMLLPLIVSCFSKIQIGFSFLVPAHLGSPGKRAVKRVCVYIYIYIYIYYICTIACWGLKGYGCGECLQVAQSVVFMAAFLVTVLCLANRLLLAYWELCSVRP